MTESDRSRQQNASADGLPLVAPCRPLSWRAPFGWLRRGWQDLRAAPRASLCYGLIMVAMSYGITAAAFFLGNLGLYLGLASGFVFLGPLIAMTLYAVSARLQEQAPVSVQRTLRDALQTLGDAAVFALVLLVIFLVWARAASMMHVFFPVSGEKGLLDWLVFLGAGSAVGAIFCAIIFLASAFSLPMMLERRSDSITAVLSSANAALRNKPAMLVWAACIALFVLLGLASFYLAFVVLLPWLGYATWHAYQEALDTSAWPRRPLR